MCVTQSVYYPFNLLFAILLMADKVDVCKCVICHGCHSTGCSDCLGG